MSDVADEGGDPACWAHLFDDEGLAETDRASTAPVATGPPSLDPDDEQDGPA